MKIERKLKLIIKSIKINHIIIFIFINLACLFLSFNIFEKNSSIKNQLTLNVKIPQYSLLEVGSFINILDTKHISYKLNRLDKNKIFIEECKINPVEKDRHISYSSEQDNRFAIDGDLQFVVKIIHPDIIILNDCADSVIKILNRLFNKNKNKLYQKLSEKLEVIKKRELELQEATQRFVNDVKKKYDNLDESVEVRIYLNNFINNMIFENLKETYVNNIETDLEIEMKKNKNLELRFFKSVEEFTLIKYQYLIQLLVINLFISSLLIIFFVFSLRKKI
jgi:hypothetical protein